MLAFAILPVALLAGFAVCMPASEPACSRFDYEEKLLAKTIRLEVTVEDLTESVTKFELTQQALEVLANKVDKIEAKCDAFESKKQEVMEKTDLPKRTCPKTYKHRPDLSLCWKLQKGLKLNAFEAEERCLEDGAHLMILNTSMTVKFMQEWLKIASVGDTYVGADDIADEGIFKWRNGELVQQIPWETGEPNGGTGSNCLVMDADVAFRFCDRECSAKNEFLCQKIV